MKSIKSIHTRYLLASTAIHSLLILFLALPALDEIRAKIAELGGLTQSSLWIPAIVLIVAVNYVILKLFKRTISEPILHVAKEIELNKPGTYAFKSISENAEEKALKHFVESQSLRTAEMEILIEDLEIERDQAMRELEVALEKTERSAKELVEALASKSDIRETAERLKAKNTVLKQELETARKQKVGNEVQKRADEIYAQMERAVESAAYKKIWLPSVLQELKTPAKIIRDLANRIDRSWGDTSLNKLKHEVDEISRQCVSQLKLLNEISKRELPPVEDDQNLNTDSQSAIIEPETTVQTTDEKPVIAPEPEAENPGMSTIADENVSANKIPESFATEPDENAKIDIVAKREIEDQPLPEPEEPAIPEKDKSTPIVTEVQIQDDLEPETTVIISDPIIDDDTDSALEELISEIVEEYELLADAFTIELTKAGLLDADVDEEEIGSILSNLLEIALNQFSSGAIRLKAEQSNNFLELTVHCDGQPNPNVGNDVAQANRIAAAMDQKVAIDMQKDNALYMHLKYGLELGDSFGS